jgi:hypothetical protein
MSILTQILVAFFSVSFGIGVGAYAIAQWWLRKVSTDQEYCRAVLKNIYRNAGHPHWLQVSEADERRVCPCCGWSETEALAGTLHAHEGVQ